MTRGRERRKSHSGFQTPIDDEEPRVGGGEGIFSNKVEERGEEEASQR
jgi:hypothetical protein